MEICKLFYFQVRESPAPLNLQTPTPAPDRGSHSAWTPRRSFLKVSRLVSKLFVGAIVNDHSFFGVDFATATHANANFKVPPCLQSTGLESSHAFPGLSFIFFHTLQVGVVRFLFAFHLLQLLPLRQLKSQLCDCLAFCHLYPTSNPSRSIVPPRLCPHRLRAQAPIVRQFMPQLLNRRSHLDATAQAQVPRFPLPPIADNSRP